MSSDLNLGRLEKVQLRDIWQTEAGDFTPWLAEEINIGLLGESIGIELEVEAQEKYVGPFRADILCKDTATNEWVLIENQLERTDHSHLGQVITYAAGLSAVTIVWIADRFTEEHRAALDWLNEVTSDEITMFGLEVELWKIGDSQVAPKFNIVSKPNDWTRSISGAAKRIQSGEMSESQQRYHDFWTFFGEQIQKRDTQLRVPKPSGDYWKNYSVGRSEYSILAMVLARDEWIGVQLSIYGSNAKRYFRLLESKKLEIEESLQLPVEWRQLPNHVESQIRLRRESIDPKDAGNWELISNWLIDHIEKFDTLFRPIIATLDPNDVDEPNESE